MIYSCISKFVSIFMHFELEIRVHFIRIFFTTFWLDVFSVKHLSLMPKFSNFLLFLCFIEFSSIFFLPFFDIYSFFPLPFVFLELNPTWRCSNSWSQENSINIYDNNASSSVRQFGQSCREATRRK